MTEDNNDRSIILRLATDAWNWSKIPAMEFTESVASCYVGQLFLKLSDKFLWLIEKSSQWALPPPPAALNEKTTAVSELTRPLPWVFFLPTLLMLRLMREGLSFGALMMGKEPVRPSTIVRCIQNWRRSLRALKYQGLKNMRVKNASKTTEKKDETTVGLHSWLYWIIIKIQSMMCYNAVKYEHTYLPKVIVRKNSGEPVVIANSEKSDNKKAPTTEDEESPNEDEDDDDDENCDSSMLRKLVQNLEQFIDSDPDDSDYSLKNEKDNGDDTSMTSSDDDDCENENYDQPEDEQIGDGKVIEKSKIEALANGTSDKNETAGPSQSTIDKPILINAANDLLATKKTFTKSYKNNNRSIPQLKRKVAAQKNDEFAKSKTNSLDESTKSIERRQEEISQNQERNELVVGKNLGSLEVTKTSTIEITTSTITRNSDENDP